MKTKLLVFIFSLYFCCLSAQEISIFKDPRDGKDYKTVTIGNQTWFAENLAYKSPNGWTEYENIAENAVKYGYLYNWETATKVCPLGWHLPSDSEWQTLELSMGLPPAEIENTNHRGENIALKLKSQTDWYSRGNGNNSSGFNAIPGGACLFYDDSFHFLGEYAYFWSDTPEGVDAWVRVLKYDDTFIERAVFSQKNKLSIRCIKD